jgi:hypothetical protein
MTRTLCSSLSALAWIAALELLIPSAKAAAQGVTAFDDDVEETRQLRRVTPVDAGGQSAVPNEAAVRAALARYAHEPRVDDLVRAADRALSGGRAEEIAARARTAGWVPRVGLRARRGLGVDLASSQTEDEEALRLSTDDDLVLEASLTFELDRVVFRSEEVALSRERRAEEQVRAARLREVVALYFERRRLQLERDLGAPGSAARGMRIAEIETLLDIFTNGAFRRMMRDTRWKTAARTSASRPPSPPRSSAAATR